VTDPDKMIADALRAIADEAEAPRAMASAAWRAGRRRRHTMTALSAAGAAAAVAVAVLLSLAAAAPGRTPLQGPAASPSAVVPARLGSPIEFRQVNKIDYAACPAGSHGLPGTGSPICYHLTRLGMTVSELESARVIKLLPGDYAVTIHLMPADTARFAALTRKLTGLPTPRCQVAIIVGGHVFAGPVAEGAVDNGTVQLVGSVTTRAQADRILQDLLSRKGVN
jgi:hypothetical protein